MPIRIVTSPGALLDISGSCSAVSVSTNYETDMAEVSAMLDGASCEVSTVASIETAEDGAIRLVGTDVNASISVAVPAVFDLCVDMRGSCQAEMAGWLEGKVAMSVEAGDIRVETVKGLLTELRTGRGDVKADSIDGNCNAETLEGSVTLGKVLGEEVRVIAGGSGALVGKAIYAKRALLQAGGGVDISALSAESGAITLGDDSKFGSLDGEIDISVAAGSVDVQAGAELRRLRVLGGVGPPERSNDGAGAGAAAGGGEGEGGGGGESGGDAATPPSPPVIELHLPETLPAEAAFSAWRLELDGNLAPRELDPAKSAEVERAAPAATTPDRTPEGASAYDANAARDALAAAASAFASVPRRWTVLVALCEAHGPIRCALEVAAPRHTLRVVKQDFMARFRR